MTVICSLQFLLTPTLSVWDPEPLFAVILFLFSSVDGWMDWWIDEWTDGWTDRLMGGWTDGWMDWQIDGWMDGLTDGWMIDRLMGGWTNGWMDWWIDGWIDRCSWQYNTANRLMFWTCHSGIETTTSQPKGGIQSRTPSWTRPHSPLWALRNQDYYHNI